MTVLSIGSREGDYRKRKVRCPSASWLGYGQGYAYPGCWITYGEMRQYPSEEEPPFPATRVARVFASVTPTTRLDQDEPKVYLAVITLAEDLTFGMLRWVDPMDVQAVLDPTKEGYPNPRALLDWVSGEGFDKAAKDPAMVLRLLEYGTVSALYISQADHHMQAWAAGKSPAAFDRS